MKSARILIVEDEIIIAENLRRQLTHYGYDVPEIALNGQEALRLFEATAPDLILMDIKLPGGMDGIETAAQIRAQSDVPIIYTTSYAGDSFTERAKYTSPSSYITKPYNVEQIRTNIELALHHKRNENVLNENTRWIRHIFQSLVDGVIVTSAQGHVRYLNPAAEQLLELSQADVENRPTAEVITLLPDGPDSRIIDPIATVLRNGSKPLIFGNAILLLQSGKEVPVHATASAMLDDEESAVGAILVFHINPEYRRQEMELAQVFRNAQRQLDQAHRRYYDLTTLLHDFVEQRRGRFPSSKADVVFTGVLRMLMERLERSYLKSNVETTDYLRSLLDWARQHHPKGPELQLQSSPLSLHVTDALRLGLVFLDIAAMLDGQALALPLSTIPTRVYLDDQRIALQITCPNEALAKVFRQQCLPSLLALGFEPDPEPPNTPANSHHTLTFYLQPRK